MQMGMFDPRHDSFALSPLRMRRTASDADGPAAPSPSILLAARELNESAVPALESSQGLTNL